MSLILVYNNNNACTYIRQRYWQVEVAGTDCYKYYQGGSCTVYFSVCGDLPDYLCGSKGVAVCQVAVSANRKNQSSFILGTTGTRSFSSLGESSILISSLSALPHT